MNDKMSGLEPGTIIWLTLSIKFQFLKVYWIISIHHTNFDDFVYSWFVMTSVDYLVGFLK